MDETVYLRKYPELENTFNKLFETLFRETDRGSVIIGTEIINDLLLEYIESTLPQMSNVMKNRLLKYPGPLSSFASRIDLSYSFRLIGVNLYSSLSELRKLRNLAAHSQNVFDLNDFEDRIANILDLGPNMVNTIRYEAIELMMKCKVSMTKEVFKDSSHTQEERDRLFMDSLNNEEVKHSLAKQVPNWQFINGLSIIAGLIHFNKVAYRNKTKDEFLKF